MHYNYLKIRKIKTNTPRLGDKINDRFNFQGYYDKTEHFNCK